MGLLKKFWKSSNNFLQHKRRNVPELVLLKCNVTNVIRDINRESEFQMCLSTCLLNLVLKNIEYFKCADSQVPIQIECVYFGVPRY